MKTVVITGITGKSGQYFLQKLLDEYLKVKDYHFIFLFRKRDTNSQNYRGYKLLEEAASVHKLNIEFHEIDLTSKDEINSVFKRPVYMLIHIAGIKITLNIVPAALQNGVDNIIMVHTTGIYSKYKAAGEEYRKIEELVSDLVKQYRARGRSISTTILRPTMIYGDLSDRNISVFIKMVDKLRLFPVVNGARYDLQPVWCKDLGNAYFDVMLHWDITKDKEYVLSGGTPIQLRTLLQEIARQLGVKNCFISCPFSIAYMGAWIIYIFTVKKIDFREKVQRLVEPRAFSHDAATRDFGYSPVPFEIGVKGEIQMYKELTGGYR